MANQWFKFYGGEYLSDPKIERLNADDRSCWVTLLCLASMSIDGTIEFLTPETLLNKSGIHFNPYDSTQWDNSLTVLQRFEKMRMIKVTTEGVIKIINWEKRQEHHLSVNERVAKHRAKKSLSNKNVTMNVTSVTSEENRIEEKEDDDTEVSSSSESRNTKQPQSKKFTSLDLDKDGLPMQPRVSQRKSNPSFLKLQNRFIEECRKHLGVSPTPHVRNLKMLSFAVNSGGLNEDQLVDLMDWWFERPDKNDTQLIQMTQMLSAVTINQYKQENNIKT